MTSNSAWSIAYEYDANSNLTQKTDPRGVVTTYVYDALRQTAVWTTQLFNDGLGRVTSVTTPDNAVVSTSYSGNSVTVTDQTGK